MSGEDRPRLLVISEFWPPAQRGGAARNTDRALRSLDHEIAAWILTGDRDVGDPDPTPGLVHGSWVERNGVHVEYGSWGRSLIRRVPRAVREVDPDVVYLTSLFAPGSLVALLRRVGRGRRLVVAPEGELQPGAMRQRRGRKRAALLALRLSGALRGVHWRAADDAEASVVRSVVGTEASVFVAPTIPDPQPPRHPRRPKRSGAAHLVHVGALNPKKGLRRLLTVLTDCPGTVRLTIAGPVADEREATACRRLAETLPDGVTVHWAGPIDHDEVGRLFADADALVLPTRAENFGYVVHEALAQGCPVAISDRTPWTSLCVSDAGWVVPLDDDDAWRSVIDEVVALDGDHASDLAERARRVAADVSAATDLDAWRAVLLPTPRPT